MDRQQKNWDQSNFRVNDRDQSTSSSSRQSNRDRSASRARNNESPYRHRDDSHDQFSTQNYDNKLNHNHHNPNQTRQQTSPFENRGWEGGAKEAGIGGYAANQWQTRSPHADDDRSHPGRSTGAAPSGYPSNQDPFDDRYQAPSPRGRSPPDSYNDGRKSKTLKSEAAEMAQSGQGQAGRPGYGNDQYSRSNQHPTEDEYYANNNSNQRGNGSPDRYTDSRQQQHQQHAPYRDNTPSPDLHPGFQRQSPPRFAQVNRSNASPSRQGDSYDHRDRNNIPRIGIPAGGASSPFADPSRGTNSPTQYTAYNPSFSPDQRGRDFESGGRNSPFTPYAQNALASSSHASYSSTDPLAGAGAGPAMSGPSYGNGPGPGFGTSSRGQSPHPLANANAPGHSYENPYDAHSISRNNLNGMDFIDPNALADDGDEGLEYHNPKRKSVLSLNRRSMGGSHPSLPGTPGGAAVGAAGLAGAGVGAAGAGTLPLESTKNLAKSNTFPGSTGANGSNIEKFPAMRDPVKSKKNKFWKRLLFVIVAVVILGAIVTGVVVGLLKRGSSNGGIGSGSSSGSSSSSGGSNSEANGGSDSGDLDIKSPSVVHLLNNKNLHKVFMGMAYTPMNTQYPDCLNLAPIQNNVTLDLAVLSQLTNTIRLYGTDCNQTAMVLHAIDKLQLTDMKIWAAIWLNNNVTTNNRQIQQFWDVIDTYGTKYIKGVIVGNEVLFRQDLTLTQLEQYVTDVRTNLTSRNVNLPVASADLGDNWTAGFAAKVDVVMSNVHPFFAGVTPDNGASWAWDFWQTHDVVLTPNAKAGQQIISEIGWPSQGGNDCGTDAGCPNATDGAVAGIPEMNTFMNGWVCQAMSNGTEYFWFEGYDEPWKQIFDVVSQNWEDHWGLLDVNRNLKAGVTIPSCGGASVPAA